jgi:two-component system nitrate/nitrite response regulator NarL
MRIVICDDHLLLLEALATALAAHGFVIEAAVTTPEDAVRAVAFHDPDLLLLDLMFPTGEGLDAARRVGVEHPRTKVVMITGTDSVQPLTEALKTGVAGYVHKNQPVKEIAAALRVAAQGELAVNGALLRRLRSTAPAAPRQPLDELTPRERQILHFLENGMDTDEIVERLGLRRSTVRTHVSSILSKLGVHSRVQAVAAQAAMRVDAATPDRHGTAD